MDWIGLLAALPRLQTPGGHAEALTLAATRRLREGDAAGALALLDRRCRLPERATAAEEAMRALAASQAREPALAAAALDRALRADPLDPTVALVALRLGGGGPGGIAAARRLLASPLAPPDTLRAALAVLFRAGEAAAARFDLADGRLAGWAAWTAGEAPALALEGPDAPPPVPLAADPRFAPAPPGGFGCFVDLPAAGAIAGYRLERAGAVLAAGALHAREHGRAGGGTGARAPDAIPDRRPLRIVVPVYDDFDATRDCLRAALAEADRHGGTRIVAVDDASPVRALRLLLDALAAEGLIELRRNLVNLGFTGAVERGLEGAQGCDVLLLNADAALPPGALARLADAAYAAPDIGTVTPMSNNGEWTSLPRLGVAADAPAPAEARRIDAAAARAGGDAVVDLPNGIGFALFVRHDCRAAVGALSAVYERGYFEDLEFTIRARRLGFRNVAAVGLFVVHHGSRSFGEARGLLVARNLRRFRRRFPGVAAQSKAFRAADPLRPARAGIEAGRPPAGRPVLVVAPAGSAAAAERLSRHAAVGEPAIGLAWRGVGGGVRVELRAADETSWPQSLGFDLDGEAGDLAGWLRALEPAAIEVAGAEAPPAALAGIVAGLGPAPEIHLGDLPAMPGDEAPLVRAFRLWNAALGGRYDRVAASDPLSLAAIGRHLAGTAEAGRIRSLLPVGPPVSPAPFAPPPDGAGAAVLGVVMARPSPAADRFVALLSAALRRAAPGARILVLGRAVDDLALLGRGNVFVTGALRPDEMGAAALRSGAAALALPYCDPSLALFERIRHETALPAAQVDWSFGGLAPPPLSLFTDPRQSDRHSAQAIVDWFAARRAA